jgi:hypothetical protein
MIWLHPPTSLLASRGYTERRKTKREREECHCRQGLSLCQLRVGGASEPNKTTDKKSGPLLRSIQFKERNYYCLHVRGIFRGMGAWVGQLFVPVMSYYSGKLFSCRYVSTETCSFFTLHTFCTVNVNASNASSKL